MLKRSLALILALVLCLGVLTACGGDPSNGPTPQQKPGDSNVSVDQSGPLFTSLTTINMTMVGNTTYELEGSYLDELLKKQENIDLNITELDNFQSVYNQMIVDQDLPDLTWLNSNFAGNKYGPLGAYINVYDYLDYMPNLKAALEKYPQAAETWEADNGGLYHIPVIQPVSNNDYAFIYRQDIFDKHGLTWPTTQEEFYNTLVKLKQLYPNSYPFVLRQMNGNMQGLQAFCTMWGTSLAQTGSMQRVMDYDYATGQWYYGPTSQGMKELVTFLNKLYKEGLLHKSSITMTSGQWTEAFAKGDTVEGVSFIGFDKMDRIPIQLQPAGSEFNPEFLLSAGAPIAFGSKGVAGTYEPGVSGYSFLISSSASNLYDIIAYVDWLYSEEGVLTTNWGKEGETYELDADGNKKWLDSLLTENDPQYSRMLNVGGMYGIQSYEAFAAWQTEHHKANMELAAKYATVKQLPTLADKYTDDEQDIFDIYATSIHDEAKSNIQKFIAGERDLAEWDAYVSKIKTMHYDELMKIHQDAYARMTSGQ